MRNCNRWQNMAIVQNDPPKCIESFKEWKISHPVNMRMKKVRREVILIIEGMCEVAFIFGA